MGVVVSLSQSALPEQHAGKCGDPLLSREEHAGMCGGLSQSAESTRGIPGSVASSASQRSPRYALREVRRSQPVSAARAGHTGKCGAFSQSPPSALQPVRATPAGHTRKFGVFSQSARPAHGVPGSASRSSHVRSGR